MSTSRETAHLLRALGTNDPTAADRLLELVYDELRALAQNQFRHQPLNHTLQPTALVHEAFLKLVGQTRVAWESRAHFLAVRNGSALSQPGPARRPAEQGLL